MTPEEYIKLCSTLKFDRSFSLNAFLKEIEMIVVDKAIVGSKSIEQAARRLKLGRTTFIYRYQIKGGNPRIGINYSSDKF